MRFLRKKKQFKLSTPFAKDFDMNKLFCRIFLGFVYLLRSTSLSLLWEIAHAYPKNPRKNPQNSLFISKSLAKGVETIYSYLDNTQLELLCKIKFNQMTH